MKTISSNQPLIGPITVSISKTRIPRGYRVIKLGNDKVEKEIPTNRRPRRHDFTKADQLILDPNYQHKNGKPYWKLIAAETGIPHQTLYSHYITSVFRYGR